MDAEFGSSARHHGADELARLWGDPLRLHLLTDTEPLQHVEDVEAARAPAVGHALGCQQRVLELLGRRDVGTRRAGAYRNAGERVCEIDPGAVDQLAGL